MFVCITGAILYSYYNYNSNSSVTDKLLLEYSEKNPQYHLYKKEKNVNRLYK